MAGLVAVIYTDNAFGHEIDKSRLCSLRIKSRSRFALHRLRDTTKLFLLLRIERILARNRVSRRRYRTDADFLHPLHRPLPGGRSPLTENCSTRLGGTP